MLEQYQSEGLIGRCPNVNDSKVIRNFYTRTGKKNLRTNFHNFHEKTETVVKKALDASTKNICNKT